MRVRPSCLAVLALAVVSCRLEPDPPTDVVALAGVRQASVRWTPSPQTSPHLPITYTVVASPGGATASTEATEAIVAGLTNGTTYTFTVIARNRFGASAPSAPSAPVTTPDLPGAPAIVEVEAGDGRARVRWMPPASDGGMPITAYTVTASPGGASVVANGATGTVAGLTNGASYTFSVAATTAVGTGPGSAPSPAVTPVPAVAFDTAEIPVGETASVLDPSWQWGPFMHVFVRAYRDANGDGEGDLAGVIEKLDYLQELGIRGLLLMPVFANQDRDHGYLTTNFRDVAPDYGSLDDLDRLLAEAHRRGMGVLLDGVLQYSGSAHPGFAAASASAAGPWRDWYVWSEADPGWGSSWWPTATGWYYGFYGRDNPVFDWRNPAVQAYHESTLRFWLNRGVDGFRIDSIRNLVQNGPWAIWDQQEDYQAGAALRRVVSQYSNRMLLCEAPFEPALPERQPFDPAVYLRGLPSYAGADVCGGGFLFSMLLREDYSAIPSQAAVLAAGQGEQAGRALIRLAYDPMQVPIASMGTLLGNHDRFAGRRLWDQLGGDGPAYRLAAATLLLMPGAPFLYYGEEVGMAETVLPATNPGSDHHQRGVMSWTGDPATAGFSARAVLEGPQALPDPDDKYLAPVPNAGDHNVEVEAADPGSLLTWYRRLIALRAGHDALARGLYQPLAVDGAAWAFERTHGDEDLLVAANYGATERTLWFKAPPGDYEVLLASGASFEPLVVPPGDDTMLSLPPQSLVVYRQGRDAPPLGDLYVLGTHNDWRATPGTRLGYLGGNRYQGSVFLPAGATQFKLSTASWDWRINVGLIGGGEVALGQPRVMEQTYWRLYGHGAEVTFVAPASGLYEFTVVADDPYAPVLTVRRGPELELPAPWQRPAAPPAPSRTGLSWVEDPAHLLTWFYADGRLLALYNNDGDTFIEFWVEGVNVIGGYDPTGGPDDWGAAVKGHAPGYPFGQRRGGYWPWEGFFAGFNYMDVRDQGGGSGGGGGGRAGAPSRSRPPPTAGSTSTCSTRWSGTASRCTTSISTTSSPSEGSASATRCGCAWTCSRGGSATPAGSSS